MAVVTVQDLIKNKDKIEQNKQALYDMQTSIGTITVKQPTRSLVAEALDMKENDDTDKYLIYECTVEPNLKDKTLTNAFECREPMDIVNKLFLAGEVMALSKQIMKNAGYGADIEAKLHEDLKN